MDQELVFKGTLPGHESRVTGIGTLPNGSVVSVSHDKSMVIWEMQPKGEQLGFASRTFKDHPACITCMCVAQDGRHTVLGSADGSIVIWDLETGVSRVQVKAHEGEVLCVAYSYDQTQIASGGIDQAVKVWNLNGDLFFNSLDMRYTHTAPVRAVGIGLAGKLASVAGNTLALWDLGTKQCIQSYQIGEHTLHSLCISPDATLLTIGGAHPTIQIWALDTHTCLTHLETSQTQPSTVLAINYNPTRYWVCFAMANNLIKVIDLDTKNVLAECSSNAVVEPGSSPAECTSIAWSPDGQILYAGYANNEIRAWEVRTRTGNVQCIRDDDLLWK